jgi:hypothetical protein
MAAPQLHDVVELDRNVDRWPPGTTGTVIDSFPGGVVVELVAPSGATLDILDLPLEDVHRVEDGPFVHAQSLGA